MTKRTYAQIERAILLKVKEGETTYARIQRATGTNYGTVKDHLGRFEKAGWVRVSAITHPSNGRRAHKVAITRNGKEYAERL